MAGNQPDADPRPGDRDRELDIVVYGATGFVGRLVAAHLARSAPEKTRIALAGRSRPRLETVRSGLGERAGDWPLLVAEADDREALERIAGAAHVVLTTVGPYGKYGKELVAACARAGTDYADLCGEVLFVRDCIDAHHGQARATGARIVNACGFDSVPSDLGVHLLHERARAEDAGELAEVTLVLTALRGGFSGGTIDSLRHQIDVMKRDPAARRLAAHPYALSPDRSAEPRLGRQSDLARIPAREVSPALRGTLAPFVMAPFNTRVVRRSNALLGHAYGSGLRYREAMSVGTSPLSPLLAAGVQAGLGALTAGLALPPTRWALDRLLPKPGDGPGEKLRREGHFTADFFARTTTGARLTARVRAQGDPGYAATAVMLGEAALALALDRAALPPTPGGVLTPATALGDALVTRLRAAGMTLTTGAASGRA
ncbi:saccharopine dehydrogenase NADP-binding domain-containing protein [Streptomyces sp. DSM 44917]|uniref:Saccharopine dehydrogenase NADP-binding domain-containing protein n=1 Tax=Streptomyces boetiae TaxID=3075541 RepID=A0ABU2LC39_9ACTN|nr:saccharopine dehydrogenase NADP-binding domain-containing protein [Streptomyces sp. DSM 44917]MDT0308753.1 saccharopine dehydrogenase NADP-binding domain-containing protein [Streptomyces sp. DSM 44917]